jgi:hypothetical protein
LCNGVTSGWELVLGGLLLALVLVAPGGVIGLGETLARRLRRRIGASP